LSVPNWAALKSSRNSGLFGGPSLPGGLTAPRSAAFHREHPAHSAMATIVHCSLATVTNRIAGTPRSSPVPLQPIDDDILTGDKTGL
jgi:hypothetical protein